MRKMLLVSILVVAAISFSGCFGLLKSAQQDSVNAATALHKQMAAGDLAGIYNNADENYRRSRTREQSDLLFSMIASKLGTPLDCKPGGVNVDVNSLGTTIHSECETRFSKNATGEEIFIWLKSSDRYRLVSYHINSRDLIGR